MSYLEPILKGQKQIHHPYLIYPKLFSYLRLNKLPIRRRIADRRFLYNIMGDDNVRTGDLALFQ